MAKVSIIIPTYNVEMYLEECMESVVNQTLEDIEIICINDGSTDGSLDILKKYAESDDRIIIVDKENGGYGIAMNIGLDKATGDYIGIVEPDDYVPLNMYEDLYKIAADNDLDFVKADFYRFKRNDDNGNMALTYNHLSVNPEDYNVIFNPSENPKTLKYIMNTWSGIYKRSFINEHGIRHNTTPGASFQDNGFWFQTFIYGKRAMIVDKPYYMNRRDNPNSSVKSKEKVYCINVEYDYIRGILSQSQEMWDKFKALWWYKKYGNYMVTLRRISQEYKREYIHQISKEFKRGLDKNEIDRSEFTEIEWENIEFLVKDPDGFYLYKFGHKDNEKKLEKEIEKLRHQLNVYKVALSKTRKELENAKKDLEVVKHTPTFRLGEILLYIPRKIKYLFKGGKA